jgi:hypothetical protein
MGIDENTKTKLIAILRAYVEEWGVDDVVVTVPADWSRLGFSSLGPVPLKFCGNNMFQIAVKKGSQHFVCEMNPDALI